MIEESLTRGPSEISASEKMNVKMKHGLAAVFAGVNDQTIAVF